MRMDAQGFSLFQAALIRREEGAAAVPPVAQQMVVPARRSAGAPARARRWLNQGPRPSPAGPRAPRPRRRGAAASAEPGSQVLLRTAGSLATESIIPSRWCSHGVMDIAHDSLRQSRNSLVTRGPLYTK